MYLLLRCITLITTLAFNPFYNFTLLASSELSAACKPDVFTSVNPPPASGPAYPAYIGAFKIFLQSTKEGRDFIAEKLAGDVNNMPVNLMLFRTNNVVETYRSWYTSKYETSVAAAAALERQKAEAAAAEARAKAELVAAQKRAAEEAARQKAAADAEIARQKAAAAAAQKKAAEDAAAAKAAADERARVTALAAAAEKAKAEAAAAEERAKAEAAAAQLVIAQKRATLLESRVATAGAILAGNKFSNEEVNALVQQIHGAETLQVKEAAFDDSSNTIDFRAIINGEEAHLKIPEMRQDEYNRLKIIIAMLSKMYSKAYNAASGAMGGLINEILNSSFPTDIHGIQIDDLSAVISKLKKYLEYHKEQRENLNRSGAFPFKNFLTVRFMKPEAIVHKKEEVLGRFREVVEQIPVTDGKYHLGSPALSKLISKINLSIMLPTPMSFSEKEISEVLRELGLLLETDATGEFILSGNYYPKLYELSQKISKALAYIEKNKNKPNADKLKIALSNLRDQIKMDRLVLDSKAKTYSFDMTSQLDISGIVKTVQELSAMDKDPAIMSSKESGFAVEAIRSSKLEPIKAVIFLINQFCPDQFNQVAKKSIFGNLDAALLGGFKAFYGKPLANVIRDLKSFKFTPAYDLKANFVSLKGSENVLAIKIFLDSLVSRTPIEEINWEATKAGILGVESNALARIRTALRLRTCELALLRNVSKTLKAKEFITKATELKDEKFRQLSLEYDVQTNLLKTDEEKALFLESYLALSKIADEGKGDRIARFLQPVLIENAPETDLVKLVLKLPELRKNHNEAIAKFASKVNSFRALKEGIDRVCRGELEGIKDADDRALAERILANLVNTCQICERFLAAGDETEALVGIGAGTAKRKSSDFCVTAGLSQLNFDVIFDHPKYDGAFYGAVKTLHFIELTTPSDNDLETLKKIILDSVPEEKRAEIKSNLETVAQASKSLREESAEFYNGIEEIIKFIEEFNKIKTKYNTDTGDDGIDFYANIDSFAKEEAVAEAGIASAGIAAAAVEFVPGPDSVERYYNEVEISALQEFYAGNYRNAKVSGKTPTAARNLLKMLGLDESLRPTRYKGDPGDTEVEEVAAHVLAPVMVSKIYGNDAALRPWLEKTNASLNAELDPLLKGTEKVNEKISKHYAPYASAQIEYFRHIDFTKIGEDDVLHFVRQLMSCVDLQLRIIVNQKIPGIIAADPGPGRDSLRKLLKTFENTYMLHSSYTIPTIVKAYISPSGLNDEMTNLMTKMLKDVNPALREIITNTVLDAFDTIDLTARDADIITPVLVAIDKYIADCTSLGQIITLKK